MPCRGSQSADLRFFCRQRQAACSSRQSPTSILALKATKIDASLALSNQGVYEHAIDLA
jgi:hypothetical protein